MRVLITGATGFVGSHVARYLLAQDCDVAALIRATSDPWRIADILPRVRVLAGDLANLSATAESIKSFAPQVTIHLAWQGVGNRHRNDPQQIANLSATLHLLEQVRAAGCRVWIGLGSQAEYGICDCAINEETPTHPTTMYGATKLCAYLLTQQICRQHELRFAWLRLFSAYGPADDRNWMIPYVILTLLRGETPALTAGAQQWDYLFVEDAVRAIYLAATDARASGVYNLGSGETHAIRDAVEHIRDLIAPGLPLGFGQVPYRPDQVMLLQADIARLGSLGWSPQVKLDEGLARTLSWFRENLRYYV